MSFGRLVRVGSHPGDQNASVYVVAEPDSAQAIRILRTKLERFDGEFQDLGRASTELLTALGLRPGESART
jgi:hypothetical protein